MVNVVGTLNVFEAARACGIGRVSYASSAAVYGPDDCGAGGEGTPPTEATPCTPGSHYGVYKVANEGNARVYFAEGGVSSVGLRPLTVYGVGRDFGMTSDPTRAMKAAVAGRPFEMRFSGATDYQYVADCADAFIAGADPSVAEGAHVFNLQGESVDMVDVVRRIDEEVPGAAVTVSGPQLPIPPAMDGSLMPTVLPPGLLPPKTALAAGIRETIAMFRNLQEQGRLDTRDIDE
jgi:nucleoside-diphosphate-sugar epimerase